MMKLLLKTWVFILLYIPLTAVAKPQFESHQAIKQLAHEHLLKLIDNTDGEYQLSVQNIDPRIKLKKCPAPIDIQLTTEHIKTGKNTLKVSCPSSQPWRLFISAQVKLFTSVIVAKHPLAKGQQIQASDLILQRTDVTLLRSSYHTDKQQLINYIVKRRLKRGEVVNNRHLAKAILIKRGAMVNILAKSEGFKISMQGIALNNASKGELIKVKNSKSKKIIQGIAIDSQTVRVTL